MTGPRRFLTSQLFPRDIEEQKQMLEGVPQACMPFCFPAALIGSPTVAEVSFSPLKAK